MSHSVLRTVAAARPILFAVSFCLLAPAFSTPVNAAPQLTIQSEVKGHPKIAKGVKDMEAALKALEAGADDFGGNKAKAEADLKAGIHSLKKALFFRLKLDDEAIDKAQW